MPTSAKIKALLRVGAKIKLKGPRADRAPAKPFPLGWQEVAEVSVADVVRVTSDARWIPTDLIEEVAP